ncbi:MAG: DUF1573 domain-containing protein [Isosphaeraceae bacterium]
MRSIASPGRLKVSEAALTWQSPASDGASRSVAENLRYELRNDGGRPVRILSVESGCGCTKQHLSAEIIKPRESAFLTVQPTPLLFGERRVPITLHTDSPSSPVVNLSLRILGGQDPPFLLSVDGDLRFRDCEAGDELEVVVQTVERSSEADREPVLRSDLPFLRFDRKGTRIKPSGHSADILVRTSIYSVQIASTPPGDSFHGEVVVIDPWLPEHVNKLRVRGETSPPIRAVPARLVVRLTGEKKDGLPGTFAVLVKTPNEADSVRAEPTGDDNPLLVEAVDADDTDGKFVRFRLRWKPGQSPRPGLSHIAISSSSGERGVRLPVLVQENAP